MYVYLYVHLYVHKLRIYVHFMDNLHGADSDIDTKAVTPMGSLSDVVSLRPLLVQRIPDIHAVTGGAEHSRMSREY